MYYVKYYTMYVNMYKTIRTARVNLLFGQKNITRRAAVPKPYFR